LLKNKQQRKDLWLRSIFLNEENLKQSGTSADLRPVPPHKLTALGKMFKIDLIVAHQLVKQDNATTPTPRYSHRHVYMIQLGKNVEQL
jgi:hypothetical protein